MKRAYSGAASGAAGRARSVLCAGVAAAVTAVTALTAVTAAAPSASAEELLAEDFASGSTPAGVWSYHSPKGAHVPCLTAATKQVEGSLPACTEVLSNKQKADPEGQGAFRLTNNANQDAGVLVLNKAVPATAGLHIKFDMYHYNAKPYDGRGGDGISFYLVDGNQRVVKAGQPGGSLGYQNAPGAIMGVGFDQFGNFSNSKFFSPGDQGPGLKPNSVVVRAGAAAKYQYVHGEDAPAQLANDGAKVRTQAKRTVNIDISKAGIMNVFVDFHDGAGMRKVIDDCDLNSIPGQPRLPDTIKLGFAGGTGAATAYHEISGFSISALDPDLITKVTSSGGLHAGGEGKLTVDVSNKADAGPTTGPVETVIDIPHGLTTQDASGDGWDCTYEDAKVICTRPGTGDDTLQPGAAYPPIDITVKANNPSPSEVEIGATADTPNEHKPSDNTDSVTVPIEQGPDLSPVVTAKDDTITAFVKNDPEAGKTTEPYTLTIPIPAGAVVEKVTPGDHWKCETEPKAVVCTRKDVLKPGQKTPPVKVKLKTNTGKPIEDDITVVVKEPTDCNPDNDKSTTPVILPGRDPNLSVTIDEVGTFESGSVEEYKIQVANAKDAGPTVGKVTTTFKIPKGLSYVSAHGDYWECSYASGVVTCSRPGVDDDTLEPGKSYPPIIVRVETPGKSCTATVKVETPEDSQTGNNTHSTETTIE